MKVKWSYCSDLPEVVNLHFLRCLNQLETATAGEIIVDGHDVTDKHTDINKVRENIGMVFQHFNLFNHLTVLDNMTLAPVHLKLMNKEEAKEQRHFSLLEACRPGR